MDILKIEASLRLCAILLLVLTACLVLLDVQSKSIFYFQKTITFKDLQALEFLVYTALVAAGYNLLQLSGCIFSIWFQRNSVNYGSYRYLAWVCYLFDQVVVFLTFATNSAAVEHSVLVITGAKELQWTKWCNKYTRFCFQAGSAMFCCCVASFLMASITCISAFNLFRLYSPRKFLSLKNAQWIC